MDDTPSNAEANHKKRKKISQRKREANRQNAQKSTGPRTEEGKAIARQNALKHGLSGAGIVLHPLDEERLKQRLDDWTRDLNPRDSVEGWMVGRAALASVRLDRCAFGERAEIGAKVKQASDRWLNDAQWRAEQLAGSLNRDPWQTVEALRKTAVGCEWLIAAWDALDQSLKARGYFTDEEMTRLLRLIGCTTAPKKSDEPFATVWAAALALPARVDADAVDRFRDGWTKKLSDAERQAESRKHLPAREQAQHLIGQLIRIERERLITLAPKLWTEVDGPARAQAEQRALASVSDSTEKMSRYEKANSAEVHRWLSALTHRRQARAARADRLAAAPERREAVRHKLAREVLSILKSRRARRASRAGDVAAAATGLPASNGRSNGDAHSQSTAPASTPAEPFAMPQPLAERMEPALSAAAVAPGAPVVATGASENEATAAAETPSTSSSPTTSVASPGGAAAAPGAGEATA